MTTTELLATFANADLITSLSFGDKVSAGLMTTVLGMGITFSALIILLFIITLMNTFFNKTPAPSVTPVKVQPSEKTVVAPLESKRDSDNEIVAAITTAIAMSLKTSTSNIVIRNIERIDNDSPQWNKAGIIEQMNNRL